MPTKNYFNNYSNQNHSNVSAIDGMDGHYFEHFCADILRKTGFTDVTVTPGSGDQGVDILATKDCVKYAIQCKNYSSVLGNTPIQEVSAGKQFYGCHVGVVMTNSTFSSGAIQLASATNVLLWDRMKLEELIEKAGGLKVLGINVGYDDYDSCDEDEEDTDYDIYDETEDDFDSGDESETKHPRKAMRILSKGCICWSIICFLIFIIGLITGDREIIMVGLAEGFFVLVLGLMFGELSKTEKGNAYMQLYGKNIKKSSFVIICIIISYILFLSVFISMGGFNTTIQ